jgi:hypothetical protein
MNLREYVRSEVSDKIKSQLVNEAKAKYAYDYNDSKKRFAVYKVDGGSVAGNHKIEQDAIDHMNKLNGSKKDESIIEAKDDVVSVHYMNKDKGFKSDKKTFKGADAYNDAVKWARKNLEKFSMDNIKYESINEAKTDGYSYELDNARKEYTVYRYDKSGNRKVPITGFQKKSDAIKHVDTLNKLRRGYKYMNQVIKSRSESVNEVQQLDEKLITFSNRAPYGQIVFLAGGAGSGKGFAADKFIDAASFKTRDVDEMKKAVGKLDAIGKISIDKWYTKYGSSLSDRPGKAGGLSPKEHIQKFVLDKGMTISKLSKNLKNSDNVASLHYIVDSMGLKDKWLEMMLKGKDNKETLPNLLFDITAKKVSSISSVIKPLIDAGYEAKNIHLIWILTNYNLAVDQNQKRSRVVASDIQLVTHEGAARTIWEILTKAIPPGLNGRIDVILNNRQHTIAYTDSQGKMVRGAIKGFKSLPIKPQGSSIYPLKDWKQRLFGWIKTNVPDTVNTKAKLDNKGG